MNRLSTRSSPPRSAPSRWPPSRWPPSRWRPSSWPGAARAWLSRAYRSRAWVGGACRVVAVVAAAVAVVLAVHGVSPGWARGLWVAAMVGFVVAVLPGLEWASAVGLVALFVAVAAQVLGTDMSMTRGVLLGLVLLVWALLTELADTVADSPRQQPATVSVRDFGRQAWPLLAAGAAGVCVVVLAAAVAPSLRIGGLAATVVAVASPALLAVAALLAWQWRGWRETDRRRPGSDGD